MKITRIDTVRVAIPFDRGAPALGIRPGLKAWDKMEGLLVRVETEDGLEGWGEAFGHFSNPATDEVIHTLVGPYMLGRDTVPIAQTMDRAMWSYHGFGRGGPVVYALSGIDIALWDLAGRRAGVPLYRMLGGSTGTVDLYASLMRYGGVAEDIARNCVAAHKAGYGMIKLHENTIPAFMAARDAVPAEVHITLDVNCAWPVEEAREIARAIRDKGFHWLEEPVWPPEDFDGLAQVRREGTPISCGENVGSLHEFKRVFEAGAVDVAQPSVSKVGGITVMARVFALAQAHSVRVVPHAFYWGPAYLATAHLAAAQPRPPLLETAFITFEVPPHASFDHTKSKLTLPDAPGLGFQPDWNALEPYVVSRRTVAA